MKIEKLNDLTYVLHFNTNVETKKLFHFVFKACEKRCEQTDCEFCELVDKCNEYWELIDALAEIAE